MYAVGTEQEYEFPDVPSSRPSRVGFWLVLGSIIAILLGVVVVIALRASQTSVDSGVSACKSMSSSVKSGDTSDDSNTPMTEASYKKARKVWEQSKFAELRTAGTTIVDDIYKLDQQSSGDDATLGDAMTTLIVLRTDWASLQAACGKHGVVLPGLPG
jgi:hypothetical protein